MNEVYLLISLQEGNMFVPSAVLSKTREREREREPWLSLT
jgi:hypothetical protein